MAENTETELTSIPEGKAGLVARIRQGAPAGSHSETLLGIGDDAAIALYDGGENTLVSTSIFAEGIHFDLTYTPLKHLGFKVVVAAMTKILAMNATPIQIAVAIAVSNKVAQRHILEFYGGVHAACEEYDIDLIGGDTTTSRTGITISATAIGRAEEDSIVRRSGARPTDLLCVTGDLGAAYMGLQLLEREKSIFNANPTSQPQLQGYEYILQRQLKPDARIDALKYLKAKAVKPTAMIAASSGLASEILHLCEASKTGCEIFEERIPIASDTKKMAKEFNINPVVAALNGGEDYELLFTIPLEAYEKTKGNDFFKIIGSINKPEHGTNIVMDDGAIMPLGQK